jgi:Mrp family chromosome partitioning ATPase
MADKNCDVCASDSCSAREQRQGESADAFLERQALARRMCQIAHKILVLSGKGGVGKSTVAVNLALSLTNAGHRVGLLDIDIHGPSIPRLLGLGRAALERRNDAMRPVDYGEKLRVMSIGFLLPDPDAAVVWRGPLKMGIIKQFLRDVDWGELDYLLIDSPPGTGDEPLSICQLIPDADGAIIVTTPQEVALADVRKSITFCKTVGMPVLGVIENMSGFVCPKCGEVTDIFKSGGGEQMALELGVAFLGSIPIDARVVEASDAGRPCLTELDGMGAAAAFERAIQPILELGGEAEGIDAEPSQSGERRWEVHPWRFLAAQRTRGQRVYTAAQSLLGLSRRRGESKTRWS